MRDTDLVEGGLVRVWSDRRFWSLRGLGAMALALGCAVGLRAGFGVGGALAAVGVALFGMFSVYAGWQATRAGPRLLLRPAGVDAADLGGVTIPWTDIDGVEAFGSPEAPFIAFRVIDPEALLRRLPWRTRLVARLLRAQGLPVFSVNLIGVHADVQVVARWAQRHLDDYGGK